MISFEYSVSLENHRDANYVRAIKDECSIKAYSMIVCFMQGKRASLYNALKALLCSEIGMLSQVI